MDPYAAAVLAARRTLEAELSGGLRADLARALVAELDALVARWLSGGVTEGQARAFAADLARALEAYGFTATDAVDAAAREAAGAAVEAHREALARLLEGRGGLGVGGAFAGVPQAAVEALYARRAAFGTDRFATLGRRNARAAAGIVDAAIDAAVMRGDSYQTAAAAVAKALATGDPYLAEAVRAHGTGAGLRRFVRGDVRASPGAARLAQSLAYDARRIALTEVHAAYHEGDRRAAQASPVVAGLRWTTNPTHPRWDVCDVYRDSDLYGLGAGVYPAAAIPVAPHPFCRCVSVPVLRPESEWGRPAPAAGVPAVDRLAVRPWGRVTPRARARAVNQAAADVWAAFGGAALGGPALRVAA